MVISNFKHNTQQVLLCFQLFSGILNISPPTFAHKLTNALDELSETSCATWLNAMDDHEVYTCDF